jgi:hypothetical protein
VKHSDQNNPKYPQHNFEELERFADRFLMGIVVLILLPSVYMTINLASAYLEAALGHSKAQWQFEFFLVPIPIFLALFALVVACVFRASRALMGACVIAFLFPCLLFCLVKFHVY